MQFWHEKHEAGDFFPFMAGGKDALDQEARLVLWSWFDFI